ncbi:MAG: AIPR family protein [Paracoccaceae bacterium]|nr:AIPR family protein [Paracoccaceae bacterium]MDE2673555.1 AIPR family protein [Paracoccaceae bacterium]
MTELEEFHHHLIADVQRDADSDGLITVESFFEMAGELLTEAGELESSNRAYFEGTVSGHTAQIDGYGGDPRDGEGILSLVLCDFQITDDLRLIYKENLSVLVNRMYRFLVASTKKAFREGLEESSAGFGLADLISSRWKIINKIKLIIITNADSRARADASKVKSIDGKPITLSVWDIKRLKQFQEQGQVRANPTIDFEEDFNGPIPVLAVSGNKTSFESYLAVIPGPQLVAIYDKWGPRLLEANVRSFLQARSKVNKGIRNTIKEEPLMFFSYNNGLSATVDSLEVKQSDKGLQLVKVDNFQIVNGGQTTASLHAAMKEHGKELEQVNVQIKLTVIPPKDSEKFVPLICEYANSQNRVNAADFFANHPFHINTERLSRRILAPAGLNGYKETKWFYERSRGQYADERSRRTTSNRRKFDEEFPRRQFLTKTDLAKYENTWECKPHIVSLGAQKNFTEFARNLEKRWGKGTAFHDRWFKHMIAKAIIFKATERIVSNSSWYEGGYRANIVTYSIAKLVSDTRKKSKLIDLDKIWLQQDISFILKSVLETAGEKAQRVISNPPEGVRNFSEWAKKPLCWERLKISTIIYPEEFETALITSEDDGVLARYAYKEKKLDESANHQIRVYELGAAYWEKAWDWAKAEHLLTPKELGIIKFCAGIPFKTPSDKQCSVAIAALEKLKQEGFTENQ